MEIFRMGSIYLHALISVSPHIFTIAFAFCNMASNKLKPVLKYKSFTEVNQLSANELKAVCVRNHISNTLPRTARVIFLCHILGLSTTGCASPDRGFLSIGEERLTAEQILTLRKLTPLNLLRLKSWSRDISSLPDIDETVVKKYLLGCNILEKSQLKTYKLSRAYQLKDNIHSVLVTQHPEYSDFYCIQARCNPSQSTQAEDVKVLHLVLDIVTGDPCSAYCTCTVGFTQACGHIGAVLCLLAKWQAHGVQTAPGEAACTDKLCPWIDPKPATVKPKRFQAIGNHDLTNKRRRTADDYGSIVINGFKPLTAEQARDFREALIQATSHLGWVCPAVYALDPSRFPGIVQPGSALSSLPPTVSLLSLLYLAYSFEVTVTSQPLPIASLPHKTFTDATHPSFLSEVDAFISSFPYSTSDLQLIPLLTLGQSNNLEWFRQKYVSLTSSNFGRIVRYMMTRKADPDVLVRDVMGYRLGANPHQRSTSAPSLKYGIRYESVARNAYVSRRKLQHRSLEVKETGLHVHPDYPHLRASPDGIVSCGCHTTTILEIKCPFSSRDISVREAVRTKKLTYLELLPDFSLRLKQDTDYYHQVQDAMAVVGVNKCDFVVYTKKSMEILRVQFDPILWERTLKDLNTFFEVYVVPEIMTARMKEVLNPPKTT
ncbi:uncharacterized protein LOC124289069 [Haliotis rubra]|uniref:uncharacterized protein LOC124289069 n=1 Tax=Haliotis rubra TaxID=36100 RepID=UPI001EE522A9|nr:uncharacterized protein LOC124289069 [Haliotis rubra]